MERLGSIVAFLFGWIALGGPVALFGLYMVITEGYWIWPYSTMIFYGIFLAGFVWLITQT